jgi:hypothetical protein
MHFIFVTTLCRSKINIRQQFSTVGKFKLGNYNVSHIIHVHRSKFYASSRILTFHFCCIFSDEMCPGLVGMQLSYGNSHRTALKVLAHTITSSLRRVAGTYRVVNQIAFHFRTCFSPRNHTKYQS